MRQRLTERRLCLTTTFEHAGPASTQSYHLSVGFFPNGKPAEIFLNSSQKSGSDSDISMSDAAIAVSLALQYGCELSEISQALRRDPNGSATGPLARALDEIEKMMKR
jgi:hypothetical protein